MGTSWLLVCTDLRRRWPTVALLTMLIGLAGAFVLTAATGARRTDSALERFLDATAMWDGSIEVAYPATEAVLADVADEPGVVATTAAVGIPLGSEELETGVISGLASGWLHDIYRPRMITGRLPDPTRADELIVNEDTAEKHHLAPGDVVVLEEFVGLGISQPMTIVGIHRGVIDLALGDTYPGAIASEAFGRRFADQMYGSCRWYPAGVPDPIANRCEHAQRRDRPPPGTRTCGQPARRGPAPSRRSRGIRRADRAGSRRAGRSVLDPDPGHCRLGASAARDGGGTSCGRRRSPGSDTPFARHHVPIERPGHARGPGPRDRRRMRARDRRRGCGLTTRAARLGAARGPPPWGLGGTGDVARWRRGDGGRPARRRGRPSPPVGARPPSARPELRAVPSRYRCLPCSDAISPIETHVGVG